MPKELTLRLYFLERFLARLSNSPYRDRLVLKGGLNLYSRYQSSARPTRDIDLMGRGLPGSVEAVERAVREIAQVDAGDGVELDLQSLKARAILEEARYPGVRVNLNARFFEAHETLQLDFSFGGVITPEPVTLPFPTLLDEPGFALLGYPLETIVAEKTAAMVELGGGNTRLKDFYDLYWIAQQEQLDPASLQKAIRRTFTQRGTPLPGSLATLQGLLTPQAQEAWELFIRRTRLGAEPDFAKVLQAILGLVGESLE